jgi:hypothetical protein
MALVRKTLFLHSAQSTTKSLATGTASWLFNQPIEGFSNPRIALTEFSYTNFFINITAPNNVIYFSDDAGNLHKYTITIPAGSYNITDLNAVVLAQQQAMTIGLLPAGTSIFTIEPDYPTGEIAIAFSASAAGFFVYFDTNAPTVLGFAGVATSIPTLPAVAVAYERDLSGVPAAFNNVQSVNVSCNLVQDSILNSSLSSNIIHVSIPTVSVGSVQLDTPINLSHIMSYALTNMVSLITINLTDQTGNPLNMSEDFYVKLHLF